MTLPTTDPRTAATTDTGIPATSEEQVAAIATAAASAFSDLRGLSRKWRAGLLLALADGLDARRGELVATAQGETGLAEARLGGELTRTVFQLRLFAEAVTEGGYLEAVIDHAGETPMGPGPDLRRMLVPIGPVAVFGSSNFPFAFSVPGGDTASALAAGNPVVVKAHGSHPLTSQAAFGALNDAATAYGAPAGTLGIVFGQAAGAALVADPRIAAVGFTGSLATGRILLDIIEHRERPIPFYGELSSLNPLVVTAGAVAARGDAIADGLFTSFTGSAGQLCTKPGIAFLPSGADALVAGLVERASSTPAQPLLNERIFRAFGDIRERLVTDGRARVLVEPRAGDDGYTMTPGILEVDAASVTEAVAEEAFGPLIVLARYTDLDEVRSALRSVPDSLTATVHSEASELADITPLVDDLQEMSGRIVFDGFPTGVRVSWGQHHGGPWPATNSAHTSVGITAIRRFLRPLAWQDVPEALLPVELHESYTGVPRRVDGVLTLARMGQ
jgi:NADP-dependent aldehyde dehydrogenase